MHNAQCTIAQALSEARVVLTVAERIFLVSRASWIIGAMRSSAKDLGVANQAQPIVRLASFFESDLHLVGEIPFARRSDSFFNISSHRRR
jgi:hypothetical protein